MKTQLLKILKSRTVWTVIFTFIFNGFAAISGTLPAEVVTTVNLILGVIATYFKMSPSQKY
jgi:hypothetical protein